MLNGQKAFVTLGLDADQYIVLAKLKSEGNKDEKSEFKVVLVDKNLAGVECTELPKLPFVPEVSHAKINFTNVKLGNFYNSDLILTKQINFFAD